MPQLDKLSFATQYFWLTLFFFGLYFLSVNFFVILVFKNLKLRNIIYKIWYFFLYKFDYVDYNNKQKSLVNTSFSFIYYTLYVNFFIVIKINQVFDKTKSLMAKAQTLNQFKSNLTTNTLNSFLNSKIISLTKEFQELNINEI